MASCVTECYNYLVMDIKDGLGKHEIKSYESMKVLECENTGEIPFQDFFLHNKQQKQPVLFGKVMKHRQAIKQWLISPERRFPTLVT